MHPKLLKQFLTLEKDRLALLSELTSLHVERFNYKPTEKSWSISQILTHLVTSEYLSLGYMKKKAQGIEQLEDSGIWEIVKILILKASQRLPLRYTAPKVVVQNTPPPMPYAELISNWEMLRSDLKEFLETIEGRNLKKKIYKHPVAGRLNVLQALTFINEHLHHHWPQITRLRK